MDAEDFQALYKLVRGNRAATAVTDARALFMEKKLSETLVKILHAQETFVESRSRLIRQDVEKQVDPKAKDADHQIKKLKRKQEKVLNAVKKFEEMIPILQKLAKREQEKLAKESPKPAPVRSEPAAQVAEAESPETSASSESDVLQVIVARRAHASQEFLEAYAAADSDHQFEVLDQCFGFQEIRSDEDVHADALYYIRTGDTSYLVYTPETSVEMEKNVSLCRAIDDKAVKPFSRKAFLKLGQDRKMVLLTLKEAPEDHDDNAETSQSDPATHDTTLKDSAEEDTDSIPKAIIDMAAFSQLMSAAQRTQILPGADQIAHVRDREFRLGKFDMAFQAIDSMFSRFNAAAGQRLQRLQREDNDIASGRIKISGKELLAKRNRDRSQTQEIDRTQRRFQVVLEGLRVLKNNQPTDETKQTS
ncbi:MAG: hypothetical protein AB8B91_21810 [Rubripirellula sp.]